MTDPVVHLFLEDGTWRKPPGAAYVLVEAQGGSSSDGNVGGLVTEVFAASELPDVVNVSIGHAAHPVALGRTTRPQPVHADRASGHGWVKVTTRIGPAG